MGETGEVPLINPNVVFCFSVHVADVCQSDPIEAKRCRRGILKKCYIVLRFLS